MVDSTQLPTSDAMPVNRPTRPVYLVDLVKSIPINPQIGDRILTYKLFPDSKHRGHHVYVICENYEIERNFGCGKKRWAIYHSTKSLRRLCSDCALIKAKKGFTI